MTTLHRTADSEARWNAWLAKGRAHDLRIRGNARFVATGLALAGAVAMVAVLLGR